MSPTPLELPDREAIRGWRLHPVAAKILLTLMLAGIVASAWLPADWAQLKAGLQFIGAFAAGMLVSRQAAIWQRIR